MGALLESGLVGNIGLKHLKVIKEDTINKWDKLGFLEGLKGHLKENVAQLYENQASHLINEASSTADSGSFETVVFPIIRRVFSKLLSNEIVSVQAMNLPIGKLFYFVPQIQGYTGGSIVNGVNVTSGDHYAPVGSPGNYPGDPNAGYAGSNAYAKNLYDLFYEGTEPGLDPAGLFDYSKGRFVTITGACPTVAWSNGALIPSAYTTSTNVEFRKIIVALSGLTSAGNGKLIGPDGQEQDTESFLSNLVLYTDVATVASNLNTTTFTPLLYRVVTQKYGQSIYGPNYNSTQAAFGSTFASTSQGNGGYYDNVCNAQGFIYLEIDAQVPACIACGQSTPDGYSGATLTPSATAWSGASANTNIKAAWRRYEELEFEDKIGEVSFDLESVTVSVTERKLRAQWSPEMAQDVAAFHTIDAEAELTALLSEQVAAEIDREILRDLRKGAAWTLRWDYNGWKRLNNQATPYTQKDWNQTLITAINQISAQIHKSTLRGGANWIVVSSEISAIFDDLEYFHVSNAAPEQDQFNMGIERVGTLSGRYQVYRDPYFPANTVLIGHKGTSLLDTGYIYAPYVPLQLTPTMYNPFNFTPIKGIMTRYAKKMVNNRFYGRIIVDGVRTFDLNELR
jgi:hypothetical protein